MLNLGDVNQGAVASDESFEDVYLEFLEADQEFVNLMNAMEIAEKAQASGSMECMNFAEELLGASINDILSTKTVAESMEAAEKNSLATLQVSIDHLLAKLEALKKGKYTDRDTENRVTVKVPAIIVLLPREGITGKVRGFLHGKTGYYRNNVPAWQAAERYKDALVALKNEIATNKNIEYKYIRAVALFVLKSTRNFLKEIKEKATRVVSTGRALLKPITKELDNVVDKRLNSIRIPQSKK